MEELGFLCVCWGYTTVMKFKEAPHGVMHSERNLNLNQVKPVKAHRHTGKVEEQESRPSGHRQTIMLPTLSFTWFVRWRDLDVRRLYAPDLTCVLCDGAVAGELSRSSNVSDDLFGPFFWVLRKRKGNFTHNEGQSKSKLKKAAIGKQLWKQFYQYVRSSRSVLHFE